VVGVGLLIWALPRPEAVDPRAWRLLAIFVATVIGIVGRALPMGAIAIVGVAVAIGTRTLTLAEALSGFSNGTVWLVVTAFFIAAAVIKTGLGARIAYTLVAAFGGSTLGLGYSLVAADLILAPVIPSNTARAGGVIFPILQSLAAAAPESDPLRRRRTNAFLTLVAYNGTVITSAMFVTAMVANPLSVQLAANQGIAISWRLWALAAVVPGAISLMLIPLAIYRLNPPGAVKTPDAPPAARAALAGLGPLTRRERLTAAILVVLLAAWIAGPTIGLDVTAAALMAVAALLVTGVLTWEDACHQHEAWSMFVWFAVLVMMATYLGQFGLVEWFTARAASAFGGIGWLPGLIGLSLIYFYSHYLFASITAHVSAMFAPFLAVALALGAPPLLAALVLAFFSNLFASLTHYGTAPAPILFGSGHVTLGTWWRVGALVSIVNIAIWLGIGGAWWRLLGLW
jgi:DASS family divalent anion:Na+ symporter